MKSKAHKLLLTAIFTFTAGVTSAYAVTPSDVACEGGMSYDFHSDVANGELVLRPTGHYLGSSLQIGSRTYKVAWQQGDPQDMIDGRQGPGYLGYDSYEQHRVVLWIDLSNTPSYPNDDWRFDGYMLIKGAGAIAGVSWLDQQYSKPWPVGFYALKRGCIPG
jgi:hypothetical protein